jgi:hypothetical protein
VRRLIRLAGLAIAVAACTNPAPSLAPSPASNVDVTGILIVDVDEPVQGGPLPRRLARQLSDALELAQANGDDLGYPWVDPDTGELVLSVVTPRGRGLVQAAGFTVPVRIRDVTHGVTELVEIEQDVMTLRDQGVTGAELIFMVQPDYRDNRTLIGMTEMSEPLLVRLASIYPVDAIAVQVDPDGGPLTFLVGPRPAADEQTRA